MPQTEKDAKKDVSPWKDGKKDKLISKEQSRLCVYCESKSHTLVECDKIVTADDQKKMFSRSIFKLNAQAKTIERVTVEVEFSVITAREDIILVYAIH